MKTESKPDGIARLSLYKNTNLNQHNIENLKPVDPHDTKYYLPKISQTFLNISAYATKFRDSKLINQSFQGYLW